MSETIESLVGIGWLPGEIVEVVLLYGGHGVLGNRERVSKAVSEINWRFETYDVNKSYSVGSLLHFENKYLEDGCKPPLTLDALRKLRRSRHDYIGVVVGLSEGNILVRRSDFEMPILMHNNPLM